MNYSPTNRRTKSAGFTLVEILVAAALVGIVGMVLFSSLISTLKLSGDNAVMNLSSYRARQTLDRLGEIVRFAHDTPVLINANGTRATGTTSDGLLIKNGIGGPYVFKNVSGQADADIPADAKSFLVEFAPSAGVSAPLPGDFFGVALSKQPELEVLSVGAVTGTPTASKVTITTREALGEVAKPGSYTVTAQRFRKEAYVFAQSGTSWNLRHYGRITGATDFAAASSYAVLSTGFQKLSGQPWFTRTTTAYGTQAIWLRAVARSSNHAEYVEMARGKKTFTSMPVQIKLWNYNAPPPPS